ncbi:MAG: methylenetetrahydrofolate--tRNA-(uracil(54)-C(5))-methyltransferase (FADH(2)-oxidizing) TrmFO [Bdellovibrionales bacterium]|nr:methylenetetrahydrofolate--tRNA-(uracil(54)-C(5))-methyltransferase (FADH(2)-oxidizing) TrmFO [Bdellovibrionales bacterium]
MEVSNTVHIVGAGLAGSECALQLADKGFSVCLYEMRGGTMTPAHKTNQCAELVCSNSFGSTMDYAAPGQLKWEASQLNSHILQAALEAQVPSGMALGVDREVFAKTIHDKVHSHPKIKVIEKVIEDIESIPRPTIIATGPLTHTKLAESISKHFGTGEFLYFFDAIAPIIDADSINMDIAFKASRWGKGGDDYINCPMNKEQYYTFIEEIQNARKIEPKEFEKDTPFFDACMPIEEIVRRGIDTPRFGPMSGKGLDDPKTGRWPYAVVQLRQDNKAATAYNIVGFQTKMAYPEQKRVFSMIPGLENAEFLKLGSIHRNLYINSPKLLNEDLSSKKDPLLFFAGQITGVEGYFDSTCIGLLVSRFVADKIKGQEPALPPRASAMGSLLYAITKEEKENFQPTNINFGLFPPLGEEHLKGKKKIPKDKKKELQITLAKEAFSHFLSLTK